MALHTLELCAGYGGIGLGLGIARGDARSVCYVEREITVAGVLAARFEDGSLEPAPVWSDLKTFDGKPWRGVVDCLVAGYPCQPFSVAGKRLGKDDPRHLWPDVARIVREVEPGEVFLENVGGHLRLGFREVAQELRRMGYRVAAGLFTAEEVGAPHRRERLFILAHSEGGRRGIVRESSRRDGLVNGRGEALEDAARLTGERGRGRGRVSQASDALANAGDGLVSQSRRRSQGRSGARPAVADVADAEHSKRRAEHEGDSEAYGRARSRRGCCDVADAGFERSQIDGNGRYPKEKRAAAAGTCRLFPPGPDDLDGWRGVLARTPEIEPAVRRSSDGLTARVDRLRALGNGVVPLVAALAYVRLMAAHGIRIEPMTQELRAAA